MWYHFANLTIHLASDKLIWDSVDLDLTGGFLSWSHGRSVAVLLGKGREEIFGTFVSS